MKLNNRPKSGQDIDDASAWFRFVYRLYVRRASSQDVVVVVDFEPLSQDVGEGLQASTSCPKTVQIEKKPCHFKLDIGCPFYTIAALAFFSGLTVLKPVRDARKPDFLRG